MENGDSRLKGPRWARILSEPPNAVGYNGSLRCLLHRVQVADVIQEVSVRGDYEYVA